MRHSEGLLRFERCDFERDSLHHLGLESIDGIRWPREHGELGDASGLVERDEVDAVNRLARGGDVRFELERPLSAVVGQPLSAIRERRAENIGRA